MNLANKALSLTTMIAVPTTSSGTVVQSFHVSAPMEIIAARVVARREPLRGTRSRSLFMYRVAICRFAVVIDM